jgi:hypothetical protein
MKLCCGLMEGQLWDAALQPSPEGSPAGGLIVVLSNEEVLSPENAEFGEFTILEATAEERAALTGAGYSMPDWEPGDAQACSACPETGCEGGKLSAECQVEEE